MDELRRGGSASLLKKTAGKMLGLGQALAGLFTGDEVMKALVASTAFEEMEIASYKNIIAAAEHFGDHDTKRVCEGILGEEVEMRDWFESQIPGYTRKYLERAERGQIAKRTAIRAVAKKLRRFSAPDRLALISMALFTTSWAEKAALQHGLDRTATT